MPRFRRRASSSSAIALLNLAVPALPCVGDGQEVMIAGVGGRIVSARARASSARFASPSCLQ
ncbi:MAG: hypothetical protein WKF75_06300 [Singulisphaera sp.]